MCHVGPPTLLFWCPVEKKFLCRACHRSLVKDARHDDTAPEDPE